MDQEPIRITGVFEQGITKPRNNESVDGARYTVPIQLSRKPSADWSEVFVYKWNHLPESASRHQPHMARVIDDKIYLEGTTLEEVEEHHQKTLSVAVEEANRIIATHEESRRGRADEQRARKREPQA